MGRSHFIEIESVQKYWWGGNGGVGMGGAKKVLICVHGFFQHTIQTHFSCPLYSQSFSIGPIETKLLDLLSFEIAFTIPKTFRHPKFRHCQEVLEVGLIRFDSVVIINPINSIKCGNN